MRTLAAKTDERVEAVYFSRDSIVVNLMDGRTISAPLAWYPKLLKASSEHKAHWELCGGGYGIHWPDIDEDLSTEGLLRGAPAPNPPKKKSVKKTAKSKTGTSRKRPRSTSKVKTS